MVPAFFFLPMDSFHFGVRARLPYTQSILKPIFYMAEEKVGIYFTIKIKETHLPGLKIVKKNSFSLKGVK